MGFEAGSFLELGLLTRRRSREILHMHSDGKPEAYRLVLRQSRVTDERRARPLPQAVLTFHPT
jgi:hypothetical protein